MSADAGVWAPLDPSHSISSAFVSEGELTSFMLGRMSRHLSEIESRWNFYDPCFLSLSAAAALHLARAGGYRCIFVGLY